MNDLRSREDIELLVNEFYSKVIDDPEIGYVFTERIQLDFEKHIPVMCDFWETTLLGQMKYKGNPMLIHIELNKKVSLKPEHFQRWLIHWESTLKANFLGTKATEALQRAKLIGELIKYKIKQTDNNSLL
ncbi:MAG: group III truncated hemoglobin [Bacteroidetes bacterium]|nr:group III truncated hemoglobin [Bacteroidota bacterium]MDA1119527.1 group III truncated hemoglobin [Bacteroidota bacterium]